MEPTPRADNVHFGDHLDKLRFPEIRGNPLILPKVKQGDLDRSIGYEYKWWPLEF